MTNTPEEQQAESSELGPTPGAQLKQAREAKGWTQEEVAQKLNFLPTYVPALEEGEYHLLPNTTFVRGYLRTYANLVGLDASTLLEAFQRHSPDLNQPETFSPVQSIKPNKKSGRLLFKLFSFLVVLGLILLVTLWWQSRTSEPLLPLIHEEVRVDTQDGPQVLLPTTPSSSSLETLDDTEPNQEQKSEALDTSATHTETALTTTDVAPTQETETEPAQAVTQPRAPQVTTNTPAAPLDLISATMDQPNRLALSFRGECWTEIRDANQRLLRAGLMNADDQLIVEGTPPFQVVFGNGRMAQIYYQGQIFDFSQRIRPNGYTSISIQ